MARKNPHPKHCRDHPHTFGTFCQARFSAFQLSSRSGGLRLPDSPAPFRPRRTGRVFFLFPPLCAEYLLPLRSPPYIVRPAISRQPVVRIKCVWKRGSAKIIICIDCTRIHIVSVNTHGIFTFINIHFPRKTCLCPIYCIFLNH